MNEDWTQLASQHHGYFTTTHAHDAGYRERTDVERHVVLCRAVLAHLGPNVALSHQSASTLYGHDQWGWDQSVVHVTRLDANAGRLEAGVQHHRSRVDDADLVERDGILTFREERVVVESAVELGTERGLCIVDACLRAGRVSKELLIARAESIPDWPGSRHARLAVRLGDGRAATVGETRSRSLFWRSGVTARWGRRPGRRCSPEDACDRSADATEDWPLVGAGHLPAPSYGKAAEGAMAARTCHG